MGIKILDCTLRDGGYINNWDFSEEVAKNIVEKLIEANVEYVEIGFLDSGVNQKKFNTRFENFDILNNFLNKIDKKKSKITVLIELGKYDLETLPEKALLNNKLDAIRVTFRKSDKEKAFSQLKIIADKGYEVFAQPITTKSYTDREILDLIEEINKIELTALAIVDTHGSMTMNDFNRIFYLYDNNLNGNIKIAFHSHNNTQLSYALAINAIEKNDSRGLIIDSSIYGMGRGAGNLNTELITEYLNEKSDKKYKIEPLLEIIENHLDSIHNETPWGYSLAMYLSARANCHPNYANYLLETRSLPYNYINIILSEIPFEERIEFNKGLIENLYFEFKKSNKLEINDLNLQFEKENILLLGPGKSVILKLDEIKEKINNEKKKVVEINHISNLIKADYYFFSNQNRYDEFKHKISKEKLIVTSNINISIKHLGCFVIDYSKLIEEDKNDNSMILFIKYLKNKGFQFINLAGFDGFKINEDNYAEELYNTKFSKNEIELLNEKNRESLKLLTEKIRIKFLTESIYSDCIKPKIIGVIPSRIGSTRLPRKALLEIEGIPLIIHVLKRVEMSNLLDEVYVATDSNEIYNEVLKYGGKAIMTSVECENGTARVVEVSKKIDGDIFVQVNGDEVLLDPKDITIAVQALLETKGIAGTMLVTETKKFNYPSELKVLLNSKDEVMIITRTDVPSANRNQIKAMLKGYFITVYPRESLEIYEKLGPSKLEEQESNNELRFIENGYKIKAIKVENQNLSVDTPNDLEVARTLMKENEIFKKYKGSN